MLLLPPLVVKLPCTVPITMVFPAVEFKTFVELALLVDVFPIKFPLTVIVPVDDLLIHVQKVVGPPIKLLPVMIKSQLPV